MQDRRAPRRDRTLGGAGLGLELLTEQRRLFRRLQEFRLFGEFGFDRASRHLGRRRGRRKPPSQSIHFRCPCCLDAADALFSPKRFGIEPRIAMLSYSSGTSGVGEEVEKVRKATALVKELRPDLKVEGPIQYDAAVDPVVGKQKMPDSEVAGRASVLIFPDLNTGNNTYKAVQRETGALAIGPMLQGLNKPVNDLSRGCTVDDIFNTVIITAIQSQEV